MKIKSSLLIIFFLLAAKFLAAQGGSVVNEGDQVIYYVDFHTDNFYSWEVVAGFNPTVNADPSEYLFLSDSDSSEVNIQWNLAGQYYLMVTETDVSGCTNTKAIAIQVLPENRTFRFGAVASEECFDLSENGYDLLLSIRNNSGQPLLSDYFPVTINFTVNGTDHSQLVEYNNQFLQIKDLWINADSDQNTDVVVQLTSAMDKNNVPISPGDTNIIHTRTLFAIPEIQFAED